MTILKRWRKRRLEANSCSEELGRAVRSNPGVVSLRFDYQSNRLEMEYDRFRLDAVQVQRLVDELVQELASRVPTCALRGGEGLCEDCLEVARSGKRWTTPEGNQIEASFKQNVLEVLQRSPQRTPTDRIVRRVKAFEKIATWWQRRVFWEPLLSGLTLLFLIVGLVAQNLGSPAWVFDASIVLAYLAGGYFGVIDGYQTLKGRRLDVNLLMILAALGAAVVKETPEGATLLFLFSLSNTLQNFALARSRRAIRSLMALKPDTATVLRDGVAEEVPAELLQIGEVVLVRPGERIPTDGTVVRGESHVDQSPITGESLPVFKEIGSGVYAGTLNGNGVLEIQVTQPPEHTLLSRIMELVEQAQEQKARTQRWLEVFEQRYALAVIGGAALTTLLLPLASGMTLSDAFYRAMTVLVVASPCALVISTPATLLSAIANAARHGVLFKGGEPIERLAGVKAIAFDKTGTLTEGKLRVTDLIPVNIPSDEGMGEWECGGVGGKSVDVWKFGGVEGKSPEALSQNLEAKTQIDYLYQLLLDVESLSEHPLAQALASAAGAKGFSAQPVEEFRAIPGKGVWARRQGKEVLIGNPPLFLEQLGQEPPESVQALLTRLQGEGKTAVVVYEACPEHGRRKGCWLGVVAVADTIRPTAKPALEALKRMNLHSLVMLSGDAERIAEAIAEQVGLERVYADLLPDQKLEVLSTLAQETGSIAMVGDGVNDAPALAAATVGIAMGAGTDVALETADVALIGNDLTNVPYAVALSRQAIRILKQNLTFAVGVIAVLLILTFAAGIRMPIGVVGHEGSTLIVVLNGLRLLRFRG